MHVDEKKVGFLLKMLADAKPDCLDCDGCFENIAEYAERQLMCKPIDEAMKDVETHLRQCPCCHAEYKVLLEGLDELKSLEDAETTEKDDNESPAGGAEASSDE